MTSCNKLQSIYNESTDYYEFMIKLGLYGYEINNSFNETHITPMLCNEIDFRKYYSVIDIEPLKKILKFVSEYIIDESISHYCKSIIASHICSLILTYPNKSVIMPYFKIMCEKMPDIMKKTYEEQKQFLKYKIN